jgi:histidinol-phosphate aminotransferase
MLNHHDAMEASVARILEGRTYFQKEMQNLGFSCLNSDANFIHVAFGDKKHNLHNALNGRVLYRESSLHKSLEGYTRFTIAPLKIMEEVVEIIKKNL